ncbi:HCNGP-like protein-domain-containing protein [Apodospora peruviana]|uniref:HCNGP-like protein-domain-containing protein n=1 Tax=Apodospora peruviana TaxID=516989 RepID=A0AAE0MFL3_9PEZI|nr:HCNGP-like protein-domain-containing protein [Apodospora peruviana]
MGLVQYESSDEEEDEQIQTQTKPQHRKEVAEGAFLIVNNDSTIPPSHGPASTSTSAPPAEIPYLPKSTTATCQSQHILYLPEPITAAPKLQPQPEPGTEPEPATGPVLGPALGPTLPPTTTTQSDGGQLLEDVDMSFLETTSGEEAPRSPYSATRTLLRDLTLPAVANMDIPPSPPSSPRPSGLDALNAKFDNFLCLKRTKGVHFNERLAASSGLRNPALTDKMLGFVGLETDFLLAEYDPALMGDPTEQYATTLPADLWDPKAFPEWAYKGALRKAQERGNKDRERQRGEPMEFVSAGAVAGTAGSGSVSSRPGTPGVPLNSSSGGAGVKRKSRFDT